MSDTKVVVLTLGSFGEPREAVFLANRAELLAASGEDFVWVGLMADIPDQTVVWRVKDVVQGDSQFHCAEAGAQMTTNPGDGTHQIVAQLGRQHRQLIRVELAKIIRGVNLCQQGIAAVFSHWVCSVRALGHSASHFSDHAVCRQF